MRSRLAPLAVGSLLFLSACSSDPERTALETYLSEGEEIAQEMSDVGTRFETLMNVQANILSWTPDEKTELQAVVSTLDSLSERSKDVSVPEILADVHPLLTEALEEMGASVDGVASVANDPSKATVELSEDIAEHATNGERLATEYVEKLETAVRGAYPDLADDVR